MEFPDYRDPVIEGRYSHYAVSDILGTDFVYSKFVDVCASD